ncbi:Sodium/Potassium/Calcium Exchanger 1 [Manis pentadactyla]|nr:Sodium/Potassium/Calcium Exchanger 1 [Manis pentadactyla]
MCDPASSSRRILPGRRVVVGNNLWAAGPPGEGAAGTPEGTIMTHYPEAIEGCVPWKVWDNLRRERFLGLCNLKRLVVVAEN